MAPHGGGAATSGGNGDGGGERYRLKSIEKRTRSVCKKAYELATLCDVDVAVIGYLSGVDTPTIWPPDRHKIEQVIHRYRDTPAHKKVPKNQITLHIPNPAAENTKDAGEAGAVADADRIRIPFPYDEEKLIGIVRSFDSKIAEVRRMIVARRMERTAPARFSAPYRGPKAAVSGGYGDPGTADRDRGKRVARDYCPVWGWGHPDFSALAAAAMGVGREPNSSHPCLCRYCPHHRHRFTGFDGRKASRDGSDGN